MFGCLTSSIRIDSSIIIPPQLFVYISTQWHIDQPIFVKFNSNGLILQLKF